MYQTDYKEQKNAPAWRDAQNQSLVNVLVEEGKAGASSAEPIRARMKKKEKMQLGKTARTICQRDNKRAVLKAVATNTGDVDVELDSQATMVPVMALLNRERQQECLGTPSMEPAFAADFGYLADTAVALPEYVWPFTFPRIVFSVLCSTKISCSSVSCYIVSCLGDGTEFEIRLT